MRLLVITNDFPPNIGGVENYTFSLVDRWRPEDVVVLTRWVQGGEKFDSDLDFQVIRQPVGTLLPSPDLVRLASSIIVERDIDMIYLPSSPLPLGLVGPLLGARFDIPYALSVHGGEFNLPSRLPVARQLLRFVGERASVLLPQSSHAERMIEKFFDAPPPYERVTCGVDPDRYIETPTAHLGIDGPVILTCCRLVTRKGPDTLIRARSLIGDTHPDAHLVIVGDGPDRERLERLTAQLDLGDKVIFTGALPWHEVPGYYAAADIFALPTRERYFGTETEGLPLVFVEAAAAGLPLIGGRAGGVADAVRHGETGLLVDGSDPKDTADAIVSLLDDPAKRKQMGEAARVMAMTEFTWDEVFVRFRDAVERYS